MTIRPLIAGNWKMNGTAASLAEVEALHSMLESPQCDILLCPPATLLSRMVSVSGSIMIGGQDCHSASSGAHTGDVSAQMIADAGGEAVIIGHSERRSDYGEQDTLIAAKATAAISAGLLAIICVGETEAERDDGQAETVVLNQLAASVPEHASADTAVIAYEPVWAIGTGRTPTPEDITAMHRTIREALMQRFGTQGAQMRILYGGSMKPSNAAEILAIENVNGGLVGGASLKASDFSAIIAAA